MDKEAIKNLKKEFPEQNYDIKHNADRLIISKRKQVIRVYAKHLQRLEAMKEQNETISQALLRLLFTMPVSSKEFEQVQIQIDKEAFDKLNEMANGCKTRKLMYLEKLLG